jgi:hypothetical protein
LRTVIGLDARMVDAGLRPARRQRELAVRSSSIHLAQSASTRAGSAANSFE